MHNMRTYEVSLESVEVLLETTFCERDAMV